MPVSDALNKKDKKALLIRVRECKKKAFEADQDNRQKAMENIKFARVPDSQWDSTTKSERGKDRLMLEFNKTKVQCKRVINEMRANRPQEKVRGYEDNDKSTAEIFEGLIRNIWDVSDGDSIADYQSEYQVYGGYGVWEIVTQYSSDTAFDQDILVKNIPNPFCVWSDPSALDMMKQDADWWLKTEKIKKASYKSRWPKAEVVKFDDEDSGFDDDADWEEDGEDGLVRICEYWYKEPAVKQLALLVDGSTVDLEKNPVDKALIKNTRAVKCHKIKTLICSGDAILEGPNEWAGTKFPFVPVYGDYLVIDGKILWSGMVVDLKDAQRAYNSHRTNIVEIIESAAKPTDWATVTQADGHLKMWAEAHKKNFPIKLYNSDPNAPGPPVRVGGAEVPAANMQAMQIASEEMNSLAGFVFDPSGADARNISGKALNTRERQGQIATFNYPDNMGKARKLTGDILIDLIPKIYDTERSIRILGEDGAEKFMKINSQDADGNPMNDLSKGKFDLTVTIGPSYATQRQEAAEVFTEISRAAPGVWGVAGDLIIKNMDVPGAEQLSKRFELMLPPPIQKQLQEGKELPPEVQQAMMQVEQGMAALQQQSQLVQAAAGEVEAEKANATKQKSEVEIAIANLKTEEANYRTMIADFEAKVAKATADLQALAMDVSMGEANNSFTAKENDRKSQEIERTQKGAEVDTSKVKEVLDGVQNEMNDFLAASAQLMVDNSKPKPKVVGIRSKRDKGGKMIATASMDDGSEKTITGERVNGEFVGTVQ